MTVALYAAETRTLTKASKKTVVSIWYVDVAEDAKDHLDGAARWQTKMCWSCQWI